MKKSVSTVYGVLLVIGFILMALSFAFAGKKNTSFAEDSRRIELQPDRVVEVGEDVREYYFDSNQMQSEFSELTFFSVHQCVEVYADGEQIYSLEKSSTVFGRTPGNRMEYDPAAGGREEFQCADRGGVPGSAGSCDEVLSGE